MYVFADWVFETKFIKHIFFIISAVYYREYQTEKLRDLYNYLLRKEKR